MNSGYLMMPLARAKLVPFFGTYYHCRPLPSPINSTPVGSRWLALKARSGLWRRRARSTLRHVGMSSLSFGGEGALWIAMLSHALAAIAVSIKAEEEKEIMYERCMGFTCSAILFDRARSDVS